MLLRNRLTAKDYIFRWGNTTEAAAAAAAAAATEAQTHNSYSNQPVIAYMVMVTILADHESFFPPLFVVLMKEHMPLFRSGICRCLLLILEVGEALEEVVLGMPRLGVLFALGLRGGADESLHADLALQGRGDHQLTPDESIRCRQRKIFTGKHRVHKPIPDESIRCR
jgi:hypothetical protein